MKEMTEEAERKDETVKIASGPIGAFLAGVLTGASIVLTAYQIFKEKVNGKVS